MPNLPHWSIGMNRYNPYNRYYTQGSKCPPVSYQQAEAHQQAQQAYQYSRMDYVHEMMSAPHWTQQIDLDFYHQQQMAAAAVMQQPPPLPLITVIPTGAATPLQPLPPLQPGQHIVQPIHAVQAIHQPIQMQSMHSMQPTTSIQQISTTSPVPQSISSAVESALSNTGEISPISQTETPPKEFPSRENDPSPNEEEQIISWLKEGAPEATIPVEKTKSAENNTASATKKTTMDEISELLDLDKQPKQYAAPAKAQTDVTNYQLASQYISYPQYGYGYYYNYGSYM